jgi:8-oxo-dGTP pyrophosphatase MutT (NUDIX family)
MTPDATFYLSQKAFIRKRREVLILNDPACGLDFPGGKVQAGEVELAAALRREVSEETGLEIEVGRPFTIWRDDGHPLFLRTGIPVLLIGYHCVYKDGEVTLSVEHDGYRWIDRARVGELDDGSTYFAALKAYFEDAGP